MANPASDMVDQPLIHTEVLAAAQEASGRLRQLLVRLLERDELHADKETR